MLRSCNGDTVTGAYVRELREFIGASGNAFRDCPSMQETEREREHHRTDKTAEKNPAFERCVQNDLAAARLLGWIGFLLGLRRGSCRIFSDHVLGPLYRMAMERPAPSGVPATPTRGAPACAKGLN
jgi:hypothetical protein